MVVLLVEFLEEIFAPLLRPLDDDRPVQPEVPLLLTGIRVVVVVILSELPHDAGFVVAVSGEFCTLDLKEIVGSVFVLGLLWVGDGIIGVRVDRAFEIRLLPVKFEAVLLAEFFELDMEVGDF